MPTVQPTDRSGERGIALVMALLMLLAVSVVTGSLVMVARTESLSSVSYTSMSQVRYGAESGVHATANFLLNTYASPTAASATDPLGAYDTTVSPVLWNGQEVILSSDPSVPSNYPVAAVRDAFQQNSVGSLTVSGAPVAYSARARLMSMSTVTDYYSGAPITLQRWEIVGVGRITGSGASVVEVEATVERQPMPVFSYAAFATFNGCNALSFAGGATTNSYDSGALGPGNTPVMSNPPTGGNVGTNGNLDGNGGPTTINGTLSTPRSGVGNCTANNVTAATLSGWGTVEEGLVPLPQPVTLNTPADINPPTSAVNFGAGSCPATAPYCIKSGGAFYITPPTPTTIVQMGNIDMNGGAEVHLRPGTYEINSVKLTGKAKIVVDNGGPVIIKVKGASVTTPIDLAGGGVSNPSMDPSKLQFIYGGTGEVKVVGGTDTAALIYAPNAEASIAGGADFYGSIVVNKITATGGSAINYDRRLQRMIMTAGSPTMTSFTWRTF